MTIKQVLESCFFWHHAFIQISTTGNPHVYCSWLDAATLSVVHLHSMQIKKQLQIHRRLVNYTVRTALRESWRRRALSLFQVLVLKKEEHMQE